MFAINAAFSNGARLSGKEVIGSKTTGAFLLLSRDVLRIDPEELEQRFTIGNTVNAAVAHQVDFSSDRKRSSMAVDLE